MVWEVSLTGATHSRHPHSPDPAGWSSAKSTRSHLEWDYPASLHLRFHVVSSRQAVWLKKGLVYPWYTLEPDARYTLEPDARHSPSQLGGSCARRALLGFEPRVSSFGVPFTFVSSNIQCLSIKMCLKSFLEVFGCCLPSMKSQPSAAEKAEKATVTMNDLLHSLKSQEWCRQSGSKSLPHFE